MPSLIGALPFVVQAGTDGAARLRNAPSTIHVEANAGEKRGVVRGEEEDGRGDVARFGEAAERDRGDELLLDRGGELVKAERTLHERRVGGDRIDGVDADLERR